MPAVLTPMQVISRSQIIVQFHVTEDEFLELLRRLAPYEKRLVSGQPGYLVSDVERELQAMRAV